jgi:hypothetical protein
LGKKIGAEWWMTLAEVRKLMEGTPSALGMTKGEK